MHPAARSTARPTRRRRFVPVVLLATMLAGLLTGVTAPARAQEDRTLTVRELGLSATAGFGADITTAGWTPVEVRLAPTRLFAGTLSILTSTEVAETIEPRDVEVAAGTEKVFRFVVPPTRSVQVRISEAGRDPLVTRLNLGNVSSGFLVGVLGSPVPPAAPPIAAVGSDLRGTYVSVDPAWLEVSPRALDSVGTLVVTSTVLGQLGDEAVGRIRHAVALGMELAIVADRAGSLDLAGVGLPWAPATAAQPAADAGSATLSLTPAPDAWTLTAEQFAGSNDAATTGEAAADGVVLIAATRAGRGRVSIVGVGLGDPGLGSDGRLWSQVLQPSSRSMELGDISTSVHRPVVLASQAVQSGGLALPSLPWLTFFLLAFVLLVGPVNGLVVSRIGRPELAWVTIPAITLVFAAGAYLGARGAAPPVGLAASTTYWVDGEGQQLAISAIRSPRAGEHVLTLPGTDWAVLPSTRTQTPTRIDRSGADTGVGMDLGALQVGTVLAWRTATSPPPLEVTARVTTLDTIAVSVTNRTGAGIDDVVIHAGTRTQRVGDLAAGETRDLEVGGLDTLATQDPWRDDFDGLRDIQGATQAPRSLEAVLRWQVLDGNPGLIWAVGTTATSSDPLPTSRSGDTDDLGALLAVGVTPSVEGDAFGPAAVDRAVLADLARGMNRTSSPLAVEGSGQVVLRYRLPATAPVDWLLPTLDRGVAEGQGFGGGGCFEQPIFDEQGNVIGSETVCADVAFPDCPPGADCAFPAPAPAPFPLPECPLGAECNLDGQIFEVCTETPDGARECTVTVIEPGRQQPFGVGGVQFEIYDHAAGRWEFAQNVVQQSAGGLRLDPARFLSPLGEVYVRASGEFWPFDYSGRGIGATIGAAA